MSKRQLMIFLGCLAISWLFFNNPSTPAAVHAGVTVVGNLSETNATTQQSLMQYQGKLLDKNSGLAKPNGTYSITFKLYSFDSGSTALWSETENITTTQGLFNAFLGDQTPLPQAIFNGQNLWLGITIAPDAEATPRQPVTYTAYAFFSENSDLLDGKHATDFASANHSHSVPAKTDVYSLSGEAFTPGSNVNYTHSYGMGGAYIHSGDGALVAPVHLPNGAVVTQLKVAFYDNSASNLDVSLEYIPSTGGYWPMANISSSRTPGYSAVVDDTIEYSTIDNTQRGYLIYAYCNAWDSGNLRVMGVYITYTITEPS